LLALTQGDGVLPAAQRAAQARFWPSAARLSSQPQPHLLPRRQAPGSGAPATFSPLRAAHRTPICVYADDTTGPDTTCSYGV